MGISLWDYAEITLGNTKVFSNDLSGIQVGFETVLTMNTNSMVYNNGTHGIEILGANAVNISDSSIYGNAESGIYARSVYGTPDELNPLDFDEVVYEFQATITIDNVDINKNGGYGIWNQGNWITVTGGASNDNALGDYLDQIGIVLSGVTQTEEEGIEIRHCINTGGFIKVDGNDQPQTEIDPLPTGETCSTP